MPEYNKDIVPTDATCALYPAIASLLRSDLLEQSFASRQDAAVAAKRQYHSLGRLAIGLIAVGSIYAVAEALVLPPQAYSFQAAVLAAAAAALGVGLQIYLVISGRKQAWLLNRFAAERLRSIKFQAYLLATSAPDTVTLAAQVEQYYTGAITRLDNEISNEVTALKQFTPRRALAPPAESIPATNAALASEARKAYLDLRTGYQRTFAGVAKEQLEGRERWTNSTSDLIYLFGAILVVLALGLKALHVGSDEVHHWIDFAAVSMFIISLSMAVLENATIDAESRSRYAMYEDNMTEVFDEASRSAMPFGTLVKQTELLALSELADFCRAALRITYRV